jgi:hypothetical protein
VVGLGALVVSLRTTTHATPFRGANTSRCSGSN